VRISLRIHQHGWGLVVRPSIRGDTGHIPMRVGCRQTTPLIWSHFAPNTSGLGVRHLVTTWGGPTARISLSHRMPTVPFMIADTNTAGDWWAFLYGRASGMYPLGLP
jgi:hypothetical protein